MVGAGARATSTGVAAPAPGEVGTQDREDATRAVFVHGACVRDGAWWWHRTAAELTRRGVASAAPGLPSCGEGGAPAGVHGLGLDEDAGAVRAVLDEGTEPTVVIAHSHGGIVAAEALTGRRSVAHLPHPFLSRPGAVADLVAHLA